MNALRENLAEYNGRQRAGQGRGSTMSHILFETVTDGVRLLTMNRPELRNALSWEAMQAFGEAIEQAADDPQVRALVITGSGGAFCSGGDLYQLDQYPTYDDGARLAAVMGDALNRLEQLPIPTLAAMEGPALGGGAELALACDLRIMADSATLGLMHIRLGITPAWGGGQRLLRLIGYPLAMEWLTTGRVLRAPEAYQQGLANRVVPEGSALEAALSMAHDIASRDPQAVRSAKRLLQLGQRLPPAEALDAERALFPELWAAPAHLEASARFVSRKNHQPK
jgi:enoyl-CoA hydratase